MVLSWTGAPPAQRQRRRLLSMRSCEPRGLQRGRASRSNSGPELILSRLVTLILAKLDGLSVCHSPDVHFGKRCGNPVSLCIHSHQCDDEVAIGQNIAHVDAERTSGEFHCAPEKTCDLVVASEIP